MRLGCLKVSVFFCRYAERLLIFRGFYQKAILWSGLN